MYIGILIIPCIATALAFTNPIIPGVNADPSAIRVGDDYFLVSSSFEYFPGIPVYHSTNLVDWELIGHGLNENNKISDRQLLTTGGIFAPTIRHHNGTFYIITTYADSEFAGLQDADDSLTNRSTRLFSFPAEQLYRNY
jgi:beta-xylosidase